MASDDSKSAPQARPSRPKKTNSKGTEAASAPPEPPPTMISTRNKKYGDAAIMPLTSRSLQDKRALPGVLREPTQDEEGAAILEGAEGLHDFFVYLFSDENLSRVRALYKEALGVGLAHKEPKQSDCKEVFPGYKKCTGLHLASFTL